jgi:predicted ATPase/DNA-binding SARP family transcriptional activator
MRVHLQTLGRLGLEGSTFKEPLPLLLLAYLALRGRTQRGHISDLLWVNLEPKQRLGSLSEAVYRLRKFSPTIISGDEEWLETTVTVDVKNLQKAVEQKNIELVKKVYKGHFLDGTERNPRFTFGEEMSEWIVNTREALFSNVFDLHLWSAEREGFLEKFGEAANLAWEIYIHGTNITYPSLETYQRLHKIMLAAEHFDEAERVFKEARDLYGPDSFYLCANPTEARTRLTHSYGFHAENPTFVDRKEDTSTVLNLLQRHRLVSMIGAPGIGKTELAQVLARLARGQDFTQDGVHIVWLETLPGNTPRGSLVTAFADALGVKAKTLEELADAIKDTKRLFVLDNFEQLSKAHGSLLLELLRLCPNLRFLVTSRELLRLESEHSYFLNYLARPKEDTTLEQAHGYPSIQLFELSAKQQGFQLTDTTLPGVIQICQLVEGLPLGIKLAASWAGSLSPSDIAEHLKQELTLLNNNEGRTRHDSIHATLESSLALLSERERLALVKLAVFQSDFTLAAAQKVTGVSLPLLRSLIEKSLVRYDFESERYSFHALVGQYVRELLEQGSEVALEVKTAHASYYLDKLDQLLEVEGEAKAHLMKLLGVELSNVEAAWLFAAGQGWWERLFVTCKALQQFGEMTARYSFTEGLLAKALGKCPEEKAACYTALGSNLALMKYRLGTYTEAIELTDTVIANLKKGVVESKERALSIAQQAYITQSFSYSSLANFPKTIELTREVHDIFLREAPDTAAYAEALVNLAIAERNILGRYDLEPYYKALEIFEARVQQDNIAWVLVLMAMCLINRIEPQGVKPLLERANRISENLGLNHWLAMSKCCQAKTALIEGHFSDAETLTERLLIQVERQDKSSMLAVVWRLRGEIEWSRPDGTLELTLEYLESALGYAHKISDIALIQGILVDRLGCFLAGERFIEAAAIYPLIKSKVSQLYYEDKKKLDGLLQKHSKTSQFLLD